MKPAGEQPGSTGAIQQHRQRHSPPDANTSSLRHSLSDVERLPLAAAVDMVESSMASDHTFGTHQQRQLEAIWRRLEVQRREQPGDDDGRFSMRLLEALFASASRRHAVPNYASEMSRQLVAAALQAPCPDRQSEHFVSAMTLVLTGPMALSATIVEAVVAAIYRSPVLLDQAAAEVARWQRAPGAPRWRENGLLTGRDVVCSAVVGRALAGGDLERATRLALLWPPTRTTLLELTRSLARRGQESTLCDVLERYNRNGSLRRDAIQTLVGLPAADSAPWLTTWLSEERQDG
jgi:hypothetical protein